MSGTPIVWAKYGDNANSPNRARPAKDWNDDPVMNDDGSPAIERHPQFCHTGDNTDQRQIDRRYQRFWSMLRDDGNVTLNPTTGSASHKNLNTDFTGYLQAKFRHRGWFAFCDCPVALVSTGAVAKTQIVEKSILGELPCESAVKRRGYPCKHAIAERDARLARRKKAMEKLERDVKDPNERAAEKSQALVVQTLERVVEVVDKISDRPERQKRGAKESGE